MLFFVRLVFGGLLALMLAEALLQLLPVSTATKTDYYISPFIVTYPPHHEFTLATGWNLANFHRHRSNNYGFLTSKEFIKDNNAVALIGDSYVEANMLKEDDRLSKQLENTLKNRPVYAMGGPGSSLLDYIERIHFAQEHFDIHDFVIVLELGDVRQTLCGSGNVHGPCLDPDTFTVRSDAAPQKVGLAKKIMRESALAQYLFSQLRLDPKDVLTKLFRNNPVKNVNNSNEIASSEQMPSVAVDKIVNTFLENLPKKEIGRTILIFDDYRDDYRDCLKKTDTSQTPVRNRFMQLASEAGVEMIDAKPIFCNFFQSTALSLNVSAVDHHWNPLANKEIAEAVAAEFRKSE